MLNVFASTEFLPVHQTVNITPIVLVVGGIIAIATFLVYFLENRRESLDKSARWFIFGFSTSCIVILSSLMAVDTQHKLDFENYVNAQKNIREKFEVSQVSMNEPDSYSDSFEVKFIEDGHEKSGVVTFDQETSEPVLSPQDV